MKVKILNLDKKREQLQEEKVINTIVEETTHVSTKELTQTMSQVNMKDEEIKGLKDNNNKLQLENKNFHKVSKELKEKVMKQKNKLKRKFQL